MAAVVIVVLIACTCRVTYIPDPVQETTIDETGAVVVVEELSVAEQYCQDNWDSLMMPTIQERAQDIATMLPHDPRGSRRGGRTVRQPRK